MGHPARKGWPTMSAVLNIENLCFAYPNQSEPTLRGIDLMLEPGSFALLCGPSGSGKSTLLRCIMQEISPAGTQTGTISGSARQPGGSAMVFQNPEAGLVHRQLLADLAFPMENAGLPQAEMTARMAETVSFLGLEPLLRREPEALSGGQKQLAALAAALMLRPRLLLLDEPVSQLDPLAARAFYDVLGHLNRDCGVTVLLSEHRTDRAMPLADRVIWLQQGRIVPAIQESPPRPQATLSVSEEAAKPLLRCRNLSFGYQKDREVLRDCSLDLRPHEFFCLLGGNGGGKSTLLRLCAGLLKSWEGKITRTGSFGYLPQETASFFLHDTVEKELRHALPQGAEPDRTLWQEYRLTGLLNRHPFDLSAGQRQLVALLALLAAQPNALLLDEPTRGLDGRAAAQIADLLRQTGVAVLAATHDIAWAAHYASRCGLLFDGRLAHQGPPPEFFARHRFYKPPGFDAK